MEELHPARQGVAGTRKCGFPEMTWAKRRECPTVSRPSEKSREEEDKEFMVICKADQVESFPVPSMVRVYRKLLVCHCGSSLP